MVSCHMLPMMASLRIFAISTVCRWGTEQPQSSFGLIIFHFVPMKIAGGHHHGSQGKSPPPPAHSDSHEVLMLYLQKSPRNKLLLLLSDESC